MRQPPNAAEQQRRNARWDQRAQLRSCDSSLLPGTWHVLIDEDGVSIRVQQKQFAMSPLFPSLFPSPLFPPFVPFVPSCGLFGHGHAERPPDAGPDSLAGQAAQGAGEAAQAGADGEAVVV